MMHPGTALRWIGAERGFGVVATEHLPKGTILYVLDPLDIVVQPGSSQDSDPLYQRTLETYAYIEPDGRRVVCWDHGRFMNHCCHPNSLSTGYGFEVAIRDIAPGEAITDHYAVLNLEHEMELSCERPDCCRHISPGSLPQHQPWMDEAIRQALADLRAVPQPLLPLLRADTARSLDLYLHTGEGYASVLSLQHLPGPRP